MFQLSLVAHLFVTSMLFFPTVGASAQSCSEVLIEAESTEQSAAFEAYPELFVTYSNIQSGKGLQVLSSVINDLTEIPFENSKNFRPPTATTSSMIQRAKDLPAELADDMVRVYNSLDDQSFLSDYYSQLFKEAAEWIVYRNRERDLEVLKTGRITIASIGHVIIRRLKQRGDNQFKTLLGARGISAGRAQVSEEDSYGNSSFRRAVGSGPFFDNVFDPWERAGHGAFTHMIQRDMTHQILAQSEGDVEGFYAFLGSKLGIAWWVELYDSGTKKTHSRPEEITKYIMHHLSIDETVTRRR